MDEYDFYVRAHLTKINELENMKINVQFNQGQVMNKATTFSEAAQATSNGMFIVGSVDKQGNFSFAANPVTHATAQLARAEARRLANLNKDKMFVITKLYGAEFVPAAPQPFSI